MRGTLLDYFLSFVIKTTKNQKAATQDINNMFAVQKLHFIFSSIKSGKCVNVLEQNILNMHWVVLVEEAEHSRPYIA